MARKTQKPPTLISDKMTDDVGEQVQELLKQHRSEIEEVIEGSDGRKLNCAFGVEMDFSESSPTVNVSIRFTSSVTDRRVLRYDDPGQLTFSIVDKSLETEQAKEAKKAAKEAKKAAKEAKKAAKESSETES